jgi:hypothetical protein
MASGTFRKNAARQPTAPRLAYKEPKPGQSGITPSSHGGIPMFATGHSFHASPVNCPADSCLAFLRFSQCSSPLLIDALHELQQYLSGSGAAARIPSYIGAPSRPPADSLLLLDATGGLAVPWVLGGAGVEGELSQGHDHQTTPPRSRFQCAFFGSSNRRVHSTSAARKRRSLLRVSSSTRSPVCSSNFWREKGMSICGSGIT